MLVRGKIKLDFKKYDLKCIYITLKLEDNLSDHDNFITAHLNIQL